ncbi:cytochrome oxidase assembly protein 1 [Coemansia sp. RSA 2049]|nr:cytochrome oxidase assembly protein 1 [Coemansia sp. RSA 2049]KAJ2517587.1 cytochrome oxidase assembly protein 1 [Coemansia sp. RSA 1939]KAJ2610986.1 cytochrome oxidase assembly protein 1 [Coemansia sp. RSA 1804]KAJ2694082.1 cytochrome oxidase assembly protein 1 [Coemansia sp. RSA 1285]
MNPLSAPLGLARALNGSSRRLVLCRSAGLGNRSPVRVAAARMSTQGETATVLEPPQQTWEAAHANNPAFAVARELPPPKSHKREIGIFVVVAAVTWGLGSVIAFNYQRMTSTPVTAALFTARHNEGVREAFGGQLSFTSAFPWISGDISHLKGVVDVEFDVVGSKEVRGHLVLKSRRITSNQNGEWKTIEFYVETPEGHRIDCS